MKYKILTGRLEEISTQVNKHLEDNWKLLGGLTCTTKGSVIEYAQAVYKEEPIKEVKTSIKRARKK